MKARSSITSDRVIAHIDLDCFYVQVERSINAELKNKPVAVVQCELHRSHMYTNMVLTSLPIDYYLFVSR